MTVQRYGDPSQRVYLVSGPPGLPATPAIQEIYTASPISLSLVGKRDFRPVMGEHSVIVLDVSPPAAASTTCAPFMVIECVRLWQLISDINK